MALLITISGLVAVASLVTARRVSDFGVRLALGATPTVLARMVVRRVAIWGLAGALIGALVTPALRPIVRLFRAEGVGQGLVWWGPGFVLVILTVALSAVVWPAWRAATAPPASVLSRPDQPSGHLKLSCLNAAGTLTPCLQSHRTTSVMPMPREKETRQGVS